MFNNGNLLFNIILIIIISYQAAISSIGGIIGYVKKGSKPSLVAGLICGGIYAYSGYLINTNNEHGHDIAAVTSIILSAVMGARVTT